MAECLSKIYQSTSFPLKMMKEFNTNEEKQGIVSILQSDSDIPKNTASSLRRTLSADMSSKKWLFQHGFKKTASSPGFSFSIADSSSSSSSDGEDEEFELWNSSIHDQKKTKIESFNSILSQKTNKDVAYVHPLVKKSKSSLSDKSLEMCTESLGSETGCDGFSSSHSISEVDEVLEDMKTDTFSINFDWNQNEFKPIQFNHKKSPPRSFPPPISCGSVRMQSRRDNGRLILEAVSSPSHNNFHADRKDGRLVLSLITTSYDQFEQSEEVFEEEVKEEEEEEELLVKDDQIIERGSEIATEKVVKMSNSVMNFHRLALMMNKSNGRIRNSPWPNEFNDVVQLKISKEVEEDASKALKQSLPPLPKAATRRMSSPSTLTVAATATAASLNAYEYYWRSKPATIQNSISQSQQPIKNNTLMLKFPNNSMGNENQNQQVLVPWSNGCKVSRRSLLLREPCCIATT